VTSFGNLYRKHDEVPGAICRRDGTTPKGRHEAGIFIEAGKKAG